MLNKMSIAILFEKVLIDVGLNN